jgi:hypothetical protein
VRTDGRARRPSAAAVAAPVLTGANACGSAAVTGLLRWLLCTAAEPGLLCSPQAPVLPQVGFQGCGPASAAAVPLPGCLAIKNKREEEAVSCKISVSWPPVSLCERSSFFLPPAILYRPREPCSCLTHSFLAPCQRPQA